MSFGIPVVDAQEFEQTYVHRHRIWCDEVFPDNVVNIGTFNGRCVAFKTGRGVTEQEIAIHHKIGKHPHIVEFVAEVSGLAPDGCKEFLMEGVEDALNLEQLRDRHDRLHLNDILSIGIAMADALQHIHSLGIVHHDIKPKNVVVRCKSDAGDAAKDAAAPLLDVDADGRPIVKVCDFGIAEELDENGHASERYRESGTINWMAPEQRRGRCEPITTAIDVYGLGSILHSLLMMPSWSDPGWKLEDVPAYVWLIVRLMTKDNPQERPTAKQAAETMRIMRDNIDAIVASGGGWDLCPAS